MWSDTKEIYIFNNYKHETTNTTCQSTKNENCFCLMINLSRLIRELLL